MNRDSCCDYRHLIAIGVFDQLRPADLKCLLRAVEYVRLLAGCAQVGDAWQVHQQVDQERRLVRIAGIEHCAAINSPHHSNILERHLRGAIFAD